MPAVVPVTKEALEGARAMIDEIILTKNCGPILVRLAWHDSGTYDQSLASEEWPAAGGAIGSIRFGAEINHGCNAGLCNALKLLEPVKEAHPTVSYADIFQLASARAIELAGGPSLSGIRYGRVDASKPEQCSPEGNLPDGNAGPGGMFGGPGGTCPTECTTPQGHLRKVFHRMGMSDEEIVALSGAHSLGRAYKDRSGEGAEKTKFTDGTVPQVRADGSVADFTKGGSSWTEQFLVFDNSYFTTMRDAASDPELLKLATDKVLFEDPAFKPFAEDFAESQDSFFKSYAAAHKKLSEQGSKFEPAGGITL